jgi:hypothetical protein
MGRLEKAENLPTTPSLKRGKLSIVENDNFKYKHAINQEIGDRVE